MIFAQNQGFLSENTEGVLANAAPPIFGLLECFCRFEQIKYKGHFQGFFTNSLQLQAIYLHLLQRYTTFTLS